MVLKSDNEVNIMKKGGHILASILYKAKNYSKPNITTLEIDSYIENLIYKNQAKPSFKNFKGYPASSCLSINEELVHTLPSKRKLKKGDILSIDAGVYFKNYHTDSAITFGIGNISDDANKIINITKKSLSEGIKLIKPGIKIGSIQNKIQTIIEENNFSVIRDLSGHFIGKRLQEEPSIPNIGKKNTGFTISKGMTFCLEPMVAVGGHHITLEKDRWTIKTRNKSLSAHFEHSIAVTKNGFLILTALD